MLLNCCLCNPLLKTFFSAHADEFLPGSLITGRYFDCNIHPDNRDSLDPHHACFLGWQLALQDYQISSGQNLQTPTNNDRRGFKIKFLKKNEILDICPNCK